MAVDKDLKQKVWNDWKNSFPNLSLYSVTNLYKIVGPVLTGLELIKIPSSDEYRPYFVLYPLWKTNVKTCFDTPLALRDFRNSRGFQWTIPFQQHEDIFGDVLKSVNDQKPLSFDSIVKLSDLMSVIDETGKRPPFVAAPNSYFQARLQQAKLELLLLTASKDIDALMMNIKERNWDTNHFAACGFNVAAWLNSLGETIANPASLFNDLKFNMQDKKIAKLPYTELAP